MSTALTTLIEHSAVVSTASSFGLVTVSTYFFWRFITCFMVFLKSLHAHTAFVMARSLQAHGYTTDAELAELKQLADAGGHVAPSAVKWFTLAIMFMGMGLI